MLLTAALAVSFACDCSARWESSGMRQVKWSLPSATGLCQLSHAGKGYFPGYNMFHETQTKKTQHKLKTEQHSSKEIPAHHKPQMKESESEGKMKRQNISAKGGEGGRAKIITSSPSRQDSKTQAVPRGRSRWPHAKSLGL